MLRRPQVLIDHPQVHVFDGLKACVLHGLEGQAVFAVAIECIRS
jgi:hypothetical protein